MVLVRRFVQVWVRRFDRSPEKVKNLSNLWSRTLFPLEPKPKGGGEPRRRLNKGKDGKRKAQLGQRSQEQ